MTTINTLQAWQAIKARLETAKSNGEIQIALRFQNETGEEIPGNTAFAFVTFTVFNQFVASYGGGRGNTRMRNPASLMIFVCVPKGEGLESPLQYGEQIAAVFRNKTFGGVSCFGAYVDPSALLPESREEVAGNYDVTAVIVDLRFDQTA